MFLTKSKNNKIQLEGEEMSLFFVLSSKVDYG